MAALGSRALLPLLPLLLLMMMKMMLVVTAQPAEMENGETRRMTEVETFAGEDTGVTGTEAEKLVGTKEELIESDVEVLGEDVRETGKQYWTPECPDGFSKYWSTSNVVSICYHVSSSKRDWFGAKDACTQLVPSSSRCFVTLATIMNYNENDFISSLMDAEGVRDHVWIGLTDRTYEGYFDWLDRRPYNFRNFYSGEPNNGNEPQTSQRPGEDCVELMYSDQWNANGLRGQWNDRSCTDQKYYACKAYCV